MKLSIIGTLPGQNTYCCKKGIVEVGLAGQPTLSKIWCCAGCGHPVEDNAKHPVIVELCKRLVTHPVIVGIEPSVHLDRCNCCQHKSRLQQINFSNGEFATVCPDCYAIYTHPDDVGLYGVGIDRLAELLGEEIGNVRVRLAATTKVFVRRRKAELLPHLVGVDYSYVEAEYSNDVQKLFMLTYSDESIALVCPKTFTVHEVSTVSGKTGMTAQRLSELLSVSLGELTGILPAVLRQNGINI